VFHVTVSDGKLDSTVSVTVNLIDKSFFGTVPADPAGGDAAIKPLAPRQYNATKYSTFNAKGEKINTRNASRYRVDFKL
ncbi:MAG: hypothetical protein MJY93_12340, partial [Fibrobacter sp.]|nr:hypothetical protein [Fibrobacter sp.]